nr:trypsin-like proteinase T2a [Yponomeuta cagnagella]
MSIDIVWMFARHLLLTDKRCSMPQCGRAIYEIYLKMFLIALLLISTSDFVLGQDPNCDYTQYVNPGRTYYVYSPGYSNLYTPGVQCRWIAICPSGYNCQIQCPDIDLPQSSSCSMDRLLVSKTGDPQLTGADTYCGRGTLTTQSTAQRLSIGLITSNSSPGGKFYCTLTAVAAGPAPCSCGYKKQNRIVGGEETGVNEFPMMAGLIDNRIESVFCGAVIIDNRYFLTAAHCLGNINTGDISVVIGEHDVTTADGVARVLRVYDRLIHPRYDRSNYDYDVAILLTETFQFTDRIGPACLPFKFRGVDMTGARVTALGWGTLFPGGPDSNVLMKVDLDVISSSTCRNRVSNLTNRQICTFTPGKDACQDDSGGPLLFLDPPTGLLFHLGIISYGRFCASNTDPGIGTRVTEFIDWIVQNTPGAIYCRI